MGLMDWAGQKAIKSEARRIAEWAAEKYPVLKAQNPDLSERELIEKMSPIDLSRLPDTARTQLQACCVSIEGLCYMMGVAFKDSPMKGFTYFRCMQFMKYLDGELYSRGFTPQSRATREAVFKAMDFSIDQWDALG